MADHDRDDLLHPDDLGDAHEIAAQAFANDRTCRLRGDAARIGDRHAHADRPDVEREDPPEYPQFPPVVAGAGATGAPAGLAAVPVSFATRAPMSATNVWNAGSSG